MTKAGNRLIEAAKEVLAIAQGKSDPFSLHIPPEIEVKSIRKKLELSQEGFAAEFGFTINQIRDWEQFRTRPIQSDRAYLLLIDRNPEAMKRMITEVRDHTLETKTARYG
jgi:putative transcriptional regulator